jgi:ribosome-associated heat shock protein Hsp15
MSNSKENKQESMRLDKWLWCARFYKTRSLASNAIKEGKIKIQGYKAKPGKLVHIGDEIVLLQKPYHYEITILKLAKSRGPAKEAILLYQESVESVKKREQLALQIKMTATAQEFGSGRPDKQQRRKIIRFTRGQN